MPIIIFKQKNINYKNKTLWLNTSQDDAKKNQVLESNVWRQATQI